MDQQNWLQKS
uniref:Uncharacterized protein n=1 Tax=Rhizophora mucronata TaxID=61149 RepID=A0A2P2R4N8_RHIMU